MNIINMSKFKLYTDGSHFKSKYGSGRLGIGSVLVKNDKVINTVSLLVDKNVLIEQYMTSDVSNPTMEMYSVLISLREFSNVFEFDDEVEVIADYVGVMNWMNRNWRINKPYILMIRNDIDNEIKKQKLKVTFSTVKGHSGDYYNDMADKLAKGLI